MFGLVLFPCLIFVPLGAVLAGVLLRGKGHPDVAKWAWWSAGLLLLAPFAELGAVALGAMLAAEAPMVAGLILALVLQFAGNICAAMAASRDDRARPTLAYVLISALIGASMFPAFRYDQSDLAVFWVLFFLPLGMFWFMGGGVAMAVFRAAFAPRIFEDEDALG